MKRLILLIILIIAVAGFFYFVKNKIGSNSSKVNNNVGIVSNQENNAPTETVPAIGQPAGQAASLLAFLLLRKILRSNRNASLVITPALILKFCLVKKIER
jgi:hypothetical protein